MKTDSLQHQSLSFIFFKWIAFGIVQAHLELQGYLSESESRARMWHGRVQRQQVLDWQG